MPQLSKNYLDYRELLSKLRVPQVRVLSVLAGNGENLPSLTRTKLQQRCGFSEKSGTITRVMNGVKEGSSSGAARPGLIDLLLVRSYVLNVDGAEEVVYKATELGLAVLRAHGPENLPPLRGRDVSTNLRYTQNRETGRLTRTSLLD